MPKKIRKKVEAVEMEHRRTAAEEKWNAREAIVRAALEWGQNEASAPSLRNAIRRYLESLEPIPGLVRRNGPPLIPPKRP